MSVKAKPLLSNEGQDPIVAFTPLTPLRSLTVSIIVKVSDPMMMSGMPLAVFITGGVASLIDTDLIFVSPVFPSAFVTL